MKEKEPIGVLGAEPLVEGVDAGARRLEQRRVIRHLARRRIREVAQDGEMDVRIHVAQRHDLEVLEQGLHPCDARQHRRHDHHRPRLVWHPAVREVETR